MDLFREMLLMLGFFMVEVHSQMYDKTTYRCQYITELYNITMQDDKAGAFCSASQLTDNRRSVLTDLFNEYREKYSRGYRDAPSGSPTTNVHRLSYHWVCEYIAWHVMFNPKLTIKHDLNPDILKRHIFPHLYRTILSDGSKVDLGTIKKCCRCCIEEYEYTVASWSLRDYEGGIDVMNSQDDAFKRFERQFKRQYFDKDTINKFLLYRSYPSVLRPGTTLFGCILRFAENDFGHNERRSTIEMACVFATHNEASQYPSLGLMDEESCNHAKPGGLFDSERNLCVAKTSPNDVPCQFYYAKKFINNEENFPPFKTCRGVNINLAVGPVPKGFSKTLVNYEGRQIQVSDSESQRLSDKVYSAPGSALKLHSLPICLIVFIASISFTFS